MAKKKSLESESKSNGPKRKYLSSDEAVVSVEENMKSKGTKKRKKAEREEDVTLQIPEISVTADDNTKEKKSTKHKQTPEPTKKKKKKRKEIAEPPTDPVATWAQGEKEGEEDLSPEEQRILERKMKKILKKEEKDKLKAEGKTEEKVEASRPVAPQQALDYLTCWAENRKEWKFQKTRQTWLLQHMFESEKIPDESFSVLLTYLEGLRGAARDTTIQKAEVLVRELGEGTEVCDSQQRAHRAREVIQLLS